MARLWGAGFGVALLALLALSIGIADLPVTDRDEARFAQAARQMAATGDWVDIRFQDGTRYKKPIGIYWLQSIAQHATDTVGTADIWVHRLPSLIGAALAAGALVWTGAPLVGLTAAALGGLMLAGTFLVGAEAKIAKTDAMLLFTIVVSMGALARAWLGTARGVVTAGVFWTAIAAGFLLKGPIVLLPIASAGVWVSIRARSLAWLAALRPVYGVAWAVLLTAPWYIAIIFKSDGAFLAEALGQDLVAKVGSAQESHGAPPGSYFLAFWLTAWPWTILAPLAAMVAWREKGTEEGAFLLGWILPMWLILEAVPTKLLHYPLPAYPAIMLFCGAALVAVPRGWGLHIGAGLWALGTLVMAGLVVATPVFYGDGFSLLAALGALAAVLLGVYGVRALYREQVWQGAATLGASGATMLAALFAVTLPALQIFWMSPRIAAEVACHEGPIYLVDYHEPSAVFLTRTDVILANRAEAEAALSSNVGAIAVMPGAGPVMISGQNYSNGRVLDLAVYTHPGVPADAPICGASGS